MLDRSHFSSKNDDNLNNPYSDGMPVLKIGLIEHRDIIEFKSTGKFSVFNDQGIAILKSVTAPVKWRVRAANRQPAKYEYCILLEKFSERQLAEEQEYRLIEKGIGARIKTMGGEIYYKNKEINDNTEHWVVVDELLSEQEARTFAEEMLVDFDYKIIGIKINEPHANLELFDTEFEKLGEADNVIKVVPDSPDVITYVYDLNYDDKVRDFSKNYAAFCGALEFRCMDEGKLTVISEMPIEEYVQNVVALQMQPDFPKEVIKAQAIVVRSRTISGLCIKHFDEPFDLCAGEHCQLFAGLMQVSDKISKAVAETAGMVLVKNKKVINANYSYICGGFTEKNYSLAADKIDDSYPPIFDSDNEENFKQYEDLTQSENFKKWVMESPDVYCNPGNFDNQQLTNHFYSYFRWHITYNRQELEEFISKHSGIEIGDLYEIIPVKRSPSGRLQEIEILASNTNLIIKDESNICKILSQERLPGSSFIIEPQFDDEGFPVSFTFHGAGYGHGVGLCQAGAVTMAIEGAEFVDILNHYFRGTQVKKIYEV